MAQFIPPANIAIYKVKCMSSTQHSLGAELFI